MALLVWLCGLPAEAVVKLPENVTVPAVFVLGDSIMDTGNNNNNMKTLTAASLPADSVMEKSHQTSLQSHIATETASLRDIKPDNILFDSENNLKLADFGSAEWFGEGGSMCSVVGTPHYVAPEVLMGRDYDEKVDVWSSGVILYIMLSGIPPFYGESAQEIFEALLRVNLRFPSRVFRSVSSAVKDLMRKMICSMSFLCFFTF